MKLDDVTLVCVDDFDPEIGGHVCQFHHPTINFFLTLINKEIQIKIKYYLRYFKNNLIDLDNIY